MAFPVSHLSVVDRITRLPWSPAVVLVREQYTRSPESLTGRAGYRTRPAPTIQAQRQISRK